MKREELTKTLIIISNWKKIFGLHVLDKNISVLDMVDTLKKMGTMVYTTIF